MFEVGQKVLCIDDVVYDHAAPGKLLVRAGEVYTISQFIPRIPRWDSYTGGQPTVKLSELPDRKEKNCFEMGYRASRFRPLNDPSIDVFREMAKKELV